MSLVVSGSFLLVMLVSIVIIAWSEIMVPTQQFEMLS